MRKPFALAIFGLSVFSIWQAGHTPLPRSRVHASDAPVIWLESARSLPADFDGPADLARALNTGNVRDLSMLAADLDGDGIGDFVAGYDAQNTGILAIFSGNIDIFSPKTVEDGVNIAHNRFPSPFHRNAKVVPTSVRPDFLAAGDFSGEGRTAIAVASSGGSAI